MSVNIPYMDPMAKLKRESLVSTSLFGVTFLGMIFSEGDTLFFFSIPSLKKTYGDDNGAGRFWEMTGGLE